MNRGARREPVFHDDLACATFLGFVSELPRRFGLLVHAYALMPNHYHLLVESTRGRLSDAMGFLGSRYALWLNARHRGWDGPVFRGRFRSVVVEREEHWHYLPIYLHLNPVRAGLVGNVSRSRWTSHGAYAGTDEVPEWLTTNDLWAGYGGSRGYVEALGEMVLGREGPPDDFDQVTLAPYIRIPKTAIPSQGRPLTTNRHVLRAVAGVCGVKQVSLSQTQRGRAGNMPRKLAAYWLVVGAGMKNAEAGALIGMHPVRISQAIREIREKMTGDPALCATMAELEEGILNR